MERSVRACRQCEGRRANMIGSPASTCQFAPNAVRVEPNTAQLTTEGGSHGRSASSLARRASGALPRDVQRHLPPERGHGRLHRVNGFLQLGVQGSHGCAWAAAPALRATIASQMRRRPYDSLRRYAGAGDGLLTAPRRCRLFSMQLASFQMASSRPLSVVSRKARCNRAQIPPWLHPPLRRPRLTLGGFHTFWPA